METSTLVWNLITSFLVALVMFMLKQASDEQRRIQILLNRTREEIARDHITRAEVKQDLEKIMERFDSGFERLEAKIDALVKKGP
jgi:Skp family chaperone for outer membrane proteins